MTLFPNLVGEIWKTKELATKHLVNVFLQMSL